MQSAVARPPTVQQEMTSALSIGSRMESITVRASCSSPWAARKATRDHLTDPPVSVCHPHSKEADPTQESWVLSGTPRHHGAGTADEAAPPQDWTMLTLRPHRGASEWLSADAQQALVLSAM